MLKGNLVAYSGMTTKIRAMKNKLLSPEQYEEITHFTTVAELISFLQTTPAYGEVLASMDPALAHRGEVESRMTFSTYSDFSKIYHFAGNSQKKYLEYYFMKYEISILKACMRNIMDSRSNANPVFSTSHSEFPTLYPCALKNVYAIPPPIINVSTLSNKLSITPILSETFAPPSIATNGLSGLFTAFPRNFNSFSIKNPDTPGI